MILVHSINAVSSNKLITEYTEWMDVLIKLSKISSSSTCALNTLVNRPVILTLRKGNIRTRSSRPSWVLSDF